MSEYTDMLWYIDDPYAGVIDYEYMQYQQDLLLREQWEVEHGGLDTTE